MFIEQLAANDLVEYRAYAGCRLTEEGHKLAEKILQNHRIIERLRKDTGAVVISTVS